MSIFGLVAGVETEEQDFSQIVREVVAGKAGAIVDADKGPVGIEEGDPGVYRVSSPDQYVQWYGEPDSALQLTAKKMTDAGNVEGVVPDVRVKRSLPKDVDGNLQAFWAGVEVNTVTPEFSQFDVSDEVTYPASNYIPPNNDVSFAIFARDPNDNSNNVGFRVRPDQANEPNRFLLEVYTREESGEPWELQEEWTASKEEERNQRGQNIYLESYITENSDYVLAVDNPANEDLPSGHAETDDPVALGGGTSGPDVTENDLINDVQVFRDPSKVDIRMMPTGGFVPASNPGLANEILDISISRRDMATIGDLPYRFSAQDAEDFNDELTVSTPPENAGSYGAFYGPWLVDREPSRRKVVEYPPSGWVANRALISFELNEPWDPVAGPNRGQLPVQDVVQKYDEAEQELLQANRINPIRDDDDFGPTIWGQETLQEYQSVTDQLHVRFTLIILETSIATFARNYLFEFSVPSTWRQLETQIDNYLAGVAGRGGLTGWRVKIDEETNTDQVLNNNGLRGFIDLEFPPVAKHIRLIFRLWAQGQAEFLESTQ